MKKIGIKKFLSMLFSVLMCFNFIFLSGCKNRKDSEKMTFVTSCYPIYIMALNLTDGVENVEVLNMSENHKGCLHNFQLQSEDLKRIEKSSAFIINGAGMELFLDKVIKELPKVRVIDSSKNIDLIKDEDCDCEEDSCTHEYNPHIWVSISNYIKQVSNIAEELSEVDPNHKEQYKKNSELYIQKLTDLKNNMHSQLDNLSNKNIITFHEAFPYFAQEFGLNIVEVINHEPDSEPQAKEIAGVIEAVKKYNIKALFVEPQYSDSSAEIISAETGAKIYTLDPAVTGDNVKDSYINTMMQNLKILKESLS